MEKAVDRRIARTRNLIQQAFYKLILESGYENIRVLDITEEANLGRATFYLHYNDKEDLLVAVIQEMRSELRERFRTEMKASPTPGLRIVFLCAAEKPALYKAVLNQIDGRKELTNIFVELMFNQIESYVDNPPIPLEVVTNHMVGATIQTLDWWLANDMPYSIDEIESYLSKITKRGVLPIIPLKKLHRIMLDRFSRQ